MRSSRIPVALLIILLVAVGVSHAQTTKPGEKRLNIPGSLSEQEMASSLMGSLTRVLQANGVKTDYVDIMGHSGAAFRAALDDRWDFGSMDIYFQFDFLKLALAAYGYGFERVPESQEAIFEAVKKSIDLKLLALGVVCGVGDFAPIIGYVPKSGEIVICEWNTGDVKYKQPTPENASNVFIIVKNGEPASLSESVRKGLEYAVWLWKEGKEPGCSWGAVAYEKWIADLRNQEKMDNLGKDFSVAAANADIFRCFRDARTQAVEYLRRHMNDLGPAAAPSLQEAAKQYSLSLEQLKTLPTMQNWNADSRERQAKRLEAALDAERKGIAAIEAALKARKKNLMEVGS